MYIHVCVGVFTRAPFSLSRLVDSTFQRMDGSLVEIVPYFPVIKVGNIKYTMYFNFPFLTILVAVFNQSWHGTIIPELGRWVDQLFSLSIFIDSVRVHFELNSLVEQLQIRLVLYVSTWVNNPIRKRDLPPHRNLLFPSCFTRYFFLMV